MYDPKRIDPQNNLRSHANWNMRDWIYLREKGYSREEIRAIWDRDAAQGKPAQRHLNGPANAREERTRTMTNAKPTAIETYRQRREDVARLLDILDMELAKFGERAEAAPKDWGFAGSMDHIRSTLIDLVEGLSGIERARIEETLAD